MINPKISKLKKPGIGFYLTVGSLLFAVLAFIMYVVTFSAFHYTTDRWVTALLIIALWCEICLVVNAVLSGDKPFCMDIFYIGGIFALTVCAIKFLIPCLSPIGIYFTVNNMGDVEANALGVPRAIVCLIFFVISIVTLAVASFFNASAKQEVKA